MIAGPLLLALCLSQADEPPPPPSPPPLIGAPEGTPVEPNAPPSPPIFAPPPPAPTGEATPPAREVEPPEDTSAPGTPTVWWKRSLASFGIATGVGAGMGGLVGLLGYLALCGGTLCNGSDLFGVFSIAWVAATFTIPAAVSLVGRAMGGRAKYGYALIGSALFGAAGLILAVAMTGGSDVPIVVIPVFSTLMILGSVASFELFSWIKEPKIKAEPVLSLGPGGGMIGVRATF